MKNDNSQSIKAHQLRKHKQLATFFFVLMAGIYILMVLLIKYMPKHWMNYAQAFSEAAMVGALADWFAVTALFHHPLGLRIPHTNLIQQKKQDIGDNLAQFVVENFLNPATIRPYVEKLQISILIQNWLDIQSNRELLIAEISKLLLDTIQKSEDKVMTHFIAQKGTDLLQTFDISLVLSRGLIYLLDKNEHERLLDFLLEKMKYYVANNEELIRERVKKESGIFVPGFVDNMIANRITVGFANFLDELQGQRNHRIRQQITQHLYTLAQQLKTENTWKNDLNALKDGLLSQQNIQQYAGSIWQNIKSLLIKELSDNKSITSKYLNKQLLEFRNNLSSNESLRLKIDTWVRFNAYRLLLRNVDKAGNLISQTVGNWEGRALSQKLELEVGKDLQFIRINGTLVGGLVGLIIYILTQWLAS